jgi:hypothetical protein
MTANGKGEEIISGLSQPAFHSRGLIGVYGRRTRGKKARNQMPTTSLLHIPFSLRLRWYQYRTTTFIPASLDPFLTAE